MYVVLVVSLLVSGCRQVFGQLDPQVTDAGPEAPPLDPDAPPDAHPLGPWSAPVVVQLGGTADDNPSATGDLLELYFNRGNNIFVAKRQQVTDPWGAPVVVAELSTAAVETTPEVSADGLTIYFATDRSGAVGAQDIMVSTRLQRTDAWSAPRFVTELETLQNDTAGGPRADGGEMVITSDTAGTFDLYDATRASLADPFTVTKLAQLDTASGDKNPCLQADGLAVYFDSDRTGNAELWLSTRQSVADSFGPPARIIELDTADREEDPWISPDGTHLLFLRIGGGLQQIMESTR